MGFKEEKIPIISKGWKKRVQNRVLYICIARSIRANKRELHAKINCSE